MFFFISLFLLRILQIIFDQSGVKLAHFLCLLLFEYELVPNDNFENFAFNEIDSIRLLILYYKHQQLQIYIDHLSSLIHFYFKLKVDVRYFVVRRVGKIILCYLLLVFYKVDCLLHNRNYQFVRYIECLSVEDFNDGGFLHLH